MRSSFKQTEYISSQPNMDYCMRMISSTHTMKPLKIRISMKRRFGVIRLSNPSLRMDAT